MTDTPHEPDTSRPLPGVTPEQRLIDLAEKAIASEPNTTWWPPAEVLTAGKRWSDEDAAFVAAASPQTIKALAEVVRAARVRHGYHSGDCIAKTNREWPDDGDCICGQAALDGAIAALDSQEEQQL